MPVLTKLTALALATCGVVMLLITAVPDTWKACAPVRYDSSHDADPAYWAQWDKLRAQGYHGRAGDSVDELWAPWCN